MTAKQLVEIWDINDRCVDAIDPDEVKPTGEAYPTGRLLDGSSDHGWDQEYFEPATLPDGRTCTRVYLFDDSDTQDDEGQPLQEEFYPWETRLARIELAEE